MSALTDCVLLKQRHPSGVAHYWGPRGVESWWGWTVSVEMEPFSSGGRFHPLRLSPSVAWNRASGGLEWKCFTTLLDSTNVSWRADCRNTYTQGSTATMCLSLFVFEFVLEIVIVIMKIGCLYNNPSCLSMMEHYSEKSSLLS